MKKILTLLVVAIFLYSCSPRVTTSISSSYEPLKAGESIMIYGLHDRVPKDLEKLGTLSIDDTGASISCSYEKVISLAKEEVRKAGGNALKITDHRKPSFWGSSCHRIKADILRLSASSGS